jgi:hypothetical protein
MCSSLREKVAQPSPYGAKTERLLSSCFTIVEIEHTAKPFAVVDRIIGGANLSQWLQQSIAHTLMISFSMIMRNIRGEPGEATPRRKAFIIAEQDYL